MLRTYAEQVSLWEAVLPDEVRRLPVELERVDRLLDDGVFFGPFVPFFHPRAGRPSTPMETYLRLMFLKFRHGLGYESLCREVADSLPLAAVLPDPVGWGGAAPDDVDEVDDPLRNGRGRRVERGVAGQSGRGEGAAHQPVTGRHHVVPANVAYPTDSGLLARAVKRIAVTGRRIQAAGGAVRTQVRDRSRSAGKRAHGIAAKLRRCAARRAATRRRLWSNGSPVSSPTWP